MPSRMKLADLIINLKWMDTTPLEYALKIVGHCYFVANKLKSILYLIFKAKISQSPLFLLRRSANSLYRFQLLFTSFSFVEMS